MVNKDVVYLPKSKRKLKKTIRKLYNEIYGKNRIKYFSKQHDVVSLVNFALKDRKMTIENVYNYIYKNNMKLFTLDCGHNLYFYRICYV